MELSDKMEHATIMAHEMAGELATSRVDGLLANYVNGGSVNSDGCQSLLAPSGCLERSSVRSHTRDV